MKSGPVAPKPQGDLTTLLALEAQLDADVSAARVEAARLVEIAKAEAAARAAKLETELGAAIRALETSVATERDQRAANALAAGRTRAAVMDQLDAARFGKVVDAATAALVLGWTR
jgi:vacuolar-type H+-ATPase subunit H